MVGERKIYPLPNLKRKSDMALHKFFGNINHYSLWSKTDKTNKKLIDHEEPYNSKFW